MKLHSKFIVILGLCLVPLWFGTSGWGDIGPDRGLRLKYAHAIAQEPA